jgi:hypothetical protein
MAQNLSTSSDTSVYLRKTLAPLLRLKKDMAFQGRLGIKLILGDAALPPQH